MSSIAKRSCIADIQLVEPVPIDDELCTGLALVEHVGLGARFVFYAAQTCYESRSQIFVVKRKVVLPLTAMRPGLRTIAEFLQPVREAEPPPATITAVQRKPLHLIADNA
jgi:hypothetical protein